MEVSMNIIKIVNILLASYTVLFLQSIYAACDATKYGPYSYALCQCKVGKVGDDIYDCYANQVSHTTESLQFLKDRGEEYGVKLIITDYCYKDAFQPYSGCLCNCRENKNVGDDIYYCYVRCLNAYSGYDQWLKDHGVDFGVRFENGKLLVTGFQLIITEIIDNVLNIKEWGVL